MKYTNPNNTDLGTVKGLVCDYKELADVFNRYAASVKTDEAKEILLLIEQVLRDENGFEELAFDIGKFVEGQND